MEKHIYDDKNGIDYTLYGDYYLPNLELMEDEEAHCGKYGMLRKTYLKEYRKIPFFLRKVSCWVRQLIIYLN